MLGRIMKPCPTVCPPTLDGAGRRPSRTLPTRRGQNVPSHVWGQQASRSIMWRNLGMLLGKEGYRCSGSKDAFNTLGTLDSWLWSTGSSTCQMGPQFIRCEIHWEPSHSWQISEHQDTLSSGQNGWYLTDVIFNIFLLCMNSVILWFKCHWNFVPRVQLKIIRHWFS